MGKISLFMVISQDGYFEGENHDLSWHIIDEKFNDFAIEQLQKADTLLFGKATYEMMYSYWPTIGARNDDPEVAKLMNEMKKVVFTNNLESADWENTKMLRNKTKEDIVNFKNSAEGELLLLGSNQVAISLMEYGLLDEIRLMVCPIAIGKGTPVFNGLNKRVKSDFLRSKELTSGNILLFYKPVNNVSI